MRDALCRWPDMTALVTMDVSSGRMVRRALGRIGRAVPEDISVIAISKSALLFDLTCLITCVEEPAREMGRRAAESVLRQVNDPETARERIVVAPDRILDLGTTGPATGGTGKQTVPA